MNNLHENVFLPRLRISEAAIYLNMSERTLLDHCTKKLISSFISCNTRYILLNDIYEYKINKELKKLNCKNILKYLC